MHTHTHDHDVDSWYNRMVKDDNWEKFRYIDVINNYNSIIEQFQEKLKEGTDDRLLLSELEEAKMDLKKLLAEYDHFKRYKDRTVVTK
jgi:DNA-binding transcriptional regulator GbsR (MarR family)